MNGDEIFTIVAGVVVCVAIVCNTVTRIKTAQHDNPRNNEQGKKL